MNAPNGRQDLRLGLRGQRINELAAGGFHHDRGYHYRLTEVPAERAIVMRFLVRLRRRGLATCRGGLADVMAMMAAGGMGVRRTGRSKCDGTTVLMAVAHSADHELQRLQSDREDGDDGLKTGRHCVTSATRVQDGRIMPKVLA
jgi:hypothetical protein